MRTGLIVVVTLLLMPTAWGQEKLDRPEQDIANDKLAEKALVGTWLHYREKDVAGTQTWVRGRKLPPSRFRGAMIFRPNGKCSIRKLAPNCRHYFVHGTYKVTQGDLYLNFGGRAIFYAAKVVSLDRNQLRLIELTPQ
ncbi:MAG: hypothetical protein QF752_06180 [Planctomycetota bacterium]|nr:hypothetical protein [Planctomycetota bacterium]